MKVLYDYQIFQQQYYGGISEYFTSLFWEWAANPRVAPTIGLRYSINEPLTDQGFYGIWSKEFLPTYIPKLASIQRALHCNLVYHIVNNQKESVRQLHRKGWYDVFHPTYYNPYFLKHLNGTPYVLTIYDMAHEDLPQYFSSRDPTARNKAECAENANKIIAISEFTKERVIKHLNISSSDIQVIHLGPSVPFRTNQTPEENRMLRLPAPYIMFVGNRDGYKNFETLFKSFLNLPEDLILVCVGGGKFTNKEGQQFTASGVSDRVRWYPAGNKNDVRLLYQNAECFVFPSLMEGFGLPALDAMVNHCPAILADIPALKEVAGDAALYFPPEDQDKLADQIMRCIIDTGTRERMELAGVRRAGMFTRKKAAEETCKVYESVL